GLRAGRKVAAAMTQLPGSFPSNYPVPMRFVAPSEALVSWQQQVLPCEDSSNVWPSLKAICVAYAAPLAQVQAALFEFSPAFSVDYHPAKTMLAHLELLKGAVHYVTVLPIRHLRDAHGQQSMQTWRSSA